MSGLENGSFDGGSPASSVPQKSSALTNKITSVLSTSYADSEIRDALQTLNTRGIRNNPDTRRHIRLDVQREVIDCNGDIIKDFGQVAEQLKRIGHTITSLNQCFEDMRRHVSAAHHETSPMLEEASTLFSQKEEVETKTQLLSAFNKHFVISDNDLELLASATKPVDDRFFNTLSRLKRVHGDCQVLLGSESHQLGLELMDKCSRSLNGAFQKLYRWIQKEFKILNLENPQMNASLRRSLRVIAERPALFQGCLDFFAETRERNLSESFYSALTGASNNQLADPSTKPIEYYAHDPLRFVGDMLAWTHSAAVSEHESLEVLFISDGDEIAKGIQAGIDSEPWLQENATAFNGKKSLEQLVSRDLGGVAQVLRQRIQQAIQNDEDPVFAYEIANLINFYRLTFARLLGSESGILETLSGLHDSALRQYRVSTLDIINSIPPEKLKTPEDLAIPTFFAAALDQLKALMKIYDSSLAPVDSQETGFLPVLTQSLDPFLEVCEHMANKLEEPANGIFAINCLLAVKATLSAKDFNHEKLLEIGDTIEEHATKLIDYQHAFFLGTSGLHPLVVALATLSDSKEDLKSIPDMDLFKTESLTETSQVLDDFLPSALMDATDNVKRLKDSKLAEEITEEAANMFCEDFEFIESRLAAADDICDFDVGTGENRQDDREGQVPLRSLFPRTSGEIRVLLS